MKKKALKKTASPAKKVHAKKSVAKKKMSERPKAIAKKAIKKSVKKVTSPKKKTKRKPETLMCFLTTACVHYYNLPDDGYELTTLRKYRDTYLAPSDSGKNIIQNYYKISPQLVSCIEQDKNKKSIYAYIYSEVQTSCKAIDSKKFELARRIYTRMVKTLQKNYLHT